MHSGLSLKTAQSVDEKQNQLSAAIVNATPEQLLALKQADNDFKSR